MPARLALPIGFVSAKLGRCARCMRLSLRGALIGWCGAAISDLLALGTYVEYVVLLWVVIFTMLWLLHIMTYGARQIVATRPTIWRLSQKPDAPTASVELDHYPVSRRELIGTFGRAVGLAILASLSVPLPTRAQPAVNGSGCNNSNSCKSNCCDPASLTCVDSNGARGRGAGCCAPTGAVQC
jgi:hypothetical protein